ncbi:MAG: outer membrane beta-barrel protein [Bacteroidota bacterium]
MKEMAQMIWLLLLLMMGGASLQAQNLSVYATAGMRQNESFDLEGGQFGVGLGVQLGARTNLSIGIRYARRRQDHQVLAVGIGNAQPQPIFFETIGSVPVNYAEFPFTIRYDVIKKASCAVHVLGGMARHESLLGNPTVASQSVILNPEIGRFWSRFGGLGLKIEFMEDAWINVEYLLEQRSVSQGYSLQSRIGLMYLL